LRHGYLCVFTFVLSCVQVAALQRADPPSNESYRLCKRSRKWKNCRGLTKGCRAINRSIKLALQCERAPRSVTYVRSFLNTSLHSHTLRCGKTLSLLSFLGRT
jgi:hypothetical protein